MKLKTLVRIKNLDLRAIKFAQRALVYRSLKLITFFLAYSELRYTNYVSYPIPSHIITIKLCFRRSRDK